MNNEGVATSLSSSTFKFLITTDNHLGYQERDPRRGDDSFTTFEECLRAARIEHDVDAILLGGDLFHDNKPSLGCLARTTALLRTYVLGDKTIEFALLSDPKRNFPTHPVPLANFQDPNINVAVPIFVIHGNHDDPVGGTSSLDILATSGLVNYFGQVSSLDDIIVEPVLLKKGQTYVALYGIGNVRDERLHRCFRMKKVRFVHPKPIAGRPWFKILLLHQNRGVRGGLGEKAGIFESMLAGLGLDLVIWGNEHEQKMAPIPSEGFDVIQPGSTILTSLSGHECNPKQYGILEIRETSYRLTPFPLRSVRPVVRRTIELWRENPSGRTLDAVEDFLRGVIVEMIEEAEEQVARIPDDVLKFHPNIKFPIMRLTVDFTDPESTNFPQPNINRFGQQYMDVVVNPGDLLRPVKPKPVIRLKAAATPNANGAVPIVPVPQVSTSDIRTKVAEVFNANARDACLLLSEPEVSAAVYAFVEKGERDAIDERICDLLNKCQKSVWKTMGRGDSDGILVPDSIYNEVVRHKHDVNKRYAEATHVDEILLLQEEQRQYLLENIGKGEDGKDKQDEQGCGSQTSMGISALNEEDSMSFGEVLPRVSANKFQDSRDGGINNKKKKDENVVADDDALPNPGLDSGVSDTIKRHITKLDEVEMATDVTPSKEFMGEKKRRKLDETVIIDVDENSGDGVTFMQPAKSSKKRSVRENAESNAVPVAKKTRSRKGKQAAMAFIPTPTLQLTHKIVPGESVLAETAAKSRETSAAALKLFPK